MGLLPILPETHCTWSARSLDLTAPDFFLWGHPKTRVFQTRPHSIQDLKNRIQAEVQEIDETPGSLQSVMNNFRVKLQQIIRYQGVQLKCVIKKKKTFLEIALFKLHTVLFSNF